jgi:hypothetical protein
MDRQVSIRASTDSYTRGGHSGSCTLAIGFSLQLEPDSGSLRFRPERDKAGGTGTTSCWVLAMPAEIRTRPLAPIASAKTAARYLHRRTPPAQTTEYENRDHYAYGAGRRLSWHPPHKFSQAALGVRRVGAQRSQRHAGPGQHRPGNGLYRWLFELRKAF